MALTSGVVKCFDRLGCNRLTPYVFDHLDLLQFAYRAGAASLSLSRPACKIKFSSLSSCLLFLSCLLSFTHTVMVVYTPHGQLRTGQFSTRVARNTCVARTRATQSQSLNALTIRSSSRMQTHSHSTDHSLIHCLYHIL